VNAAFADVLQVLSKAELYPILNTGVLAVTYTSRHARIASRVSVLFTHLPLLGGADAYMFYSLFSFVFLLFFPCATTIVHKYETTVLGNGRTDFHKSFMKIRSAVPENGCLSLSHKLLPNDRGENVVFNVVPNFGG